ncbi:MAG: 3-dehydroquinate synthase, partial [Planctomycetes bacterium]|nr:3-dehydroquinate synthase [Planctomycetota bacterium]
MKRLILRAPGGTYPALIGAGALDAIVPHLSRARPRAPSRLHVVSDRRVWRLHGARLEGLLRRLGIPWSRTILPSGEGSKSIRHLEDLWREAVRGGVDRSSCFIAFGGGVVGDITGFAAASTLRGIDFVQAPTTLLAMVDSSVGGKTGINIPEGKNLVGAFHQPRAVFLDLDLLRTLPRREVSAGWAEIVKTAAIRDPRFFRRIERQRDSLLAAEERPLAGVIARCVRIKADVVEADEREGGLRMILNFGHTLAHGIEAAQGYGGLLHGEAVAVGMVFAARLGERLGVTTAGTAGRIREVLAAYGLPGDLRGVSARRILSAMTRDKKRG